MSCSKFEPVSWGIMTVVRNTSYVICLLDSERNGFWNWLLAWRCGRVRIYGAGQGCGVPEEQKRLRQNCHAARQVPMHKFGGDACKQISSTTTSSSLILPSSSWIHELIEFQFLLPRRSVEQLDRCRLIGFWPLLIEALFSAGIPLVPVFCFGQSDAYSYIRMWPPFLPQWMYNKFVRALLFCPMLIYGSYGTPLPYRYGCFLKSYEARISLGSLAYVSCKVQIVLCRERIVRRDAPSKRCQINAHPLPICYITFN